jgi:haloacetate dehalogenase
MNRRSFSLIGLSAVAAAFAHRASAQSSRIFSPENLEQALPSSEPGATPCAELPPIPAPPSEVIEQQLFPGFKSQFLKTSGATIRVLTKGNGPPLLLLHGHPETHATWHKIAAQLAEKCTVVLTDLRGYGDSSKPDGGDDHRNYSFRAMAVDQVEIMQQLGFERFMLAGRDRGGRVAHRLCLDYPTSFIMFLAAKVMLLQ